MMINRFRFQLMLMAIIFMAVCYGQMRTNHTEGAKKKCHTIESRLNPKVKKLIKRIKVSDAERKTFKGYDKKTYIRLTRYLNSDAYISYDDDGITVEIPKVQKRIKSVEKVNRALYRRTKKLFKGKNFQSLENYLDYIADKITYHLPNPDMYRSMKKGTCVAYSSMLKVMCDISGIPCRIYAGWNTDGVGHCWNRVRIKGRWYWVDATYYDNLMYNYMYYTYSRRLWESHWEYKPVSIYRVSLPY